MILLKTVFTVIVNMMTIDFLGQVKEIKLTG